MRAWRMAEAEIAPQADELARLEAQPGAECEVHRDCWRAVRLFIDLSTQWRAVAAMGLLFTGLDYAAAEAVMRMQRMPPRRQVELLRDLQVMEGAALPLMNARKGKPGG